MMKNIVLLGSTGSIGVNVLNVVRRFPDKFRIRGLAAGRNIALLARQVREFAPELVSVVDEEHAEKFAEIFPLYDRGRIVFGTEGNIAVATLDRADFAVSAIVGAAGLLPTLAAISSGKNIGLANKETLVMAGRIVMEEVRKNNVRLFPIDSEHSAIFQALDAGRKRRCRQDYPHRFRWSVPGKKAGRAAHGNSGAGSAASQLVDGEKDYG